MILVCGEALMDLFYVADTASGRLTEAVPGGSPFNVAIGIARLGARSAFFGGLSQDGFGALLRERLAREGVDLRHAVMSDRLSTLSVVDRGRDGGATYAFHGEGKADREVFPSDLPDALGPEVRAVTFGSYTLATPPVADTLLALARREAGQRVISLDPNVRPTVTPDMRVWRERFTPFLALANIVKASDEDIRIAYGADASIDQVAAAWLAAGVTLAFVTRGGEGAVAYAAGRVPLRVTGRAVTVVDTVGAGDTFHAAALTELDRRGLLSREGLVEISDDDLRATVTYAVTAASITCTRKGADLPTDEDVSLALAGRS